MMPEHVKLRFLLKGPTKSAWGAGAEPSGVRVELCPLVGKMVASSDMLACNVGCVRNSPLAL